MKAGGDFENLVAIKKVELDRLRAVDAYAGPRLEALRFYANRKNWNPVADYADGYWYIAGQPWMLALAALKDTGVDVDQTAPTDVPDPLDMEYAELRDRSMRAAPSAAHLSRDGWPPFARMSVTTRAKTPLQVSVVESRRIQRAANRWSK